MSLALKGSASKSKTIMTDCPKTGPTFVWNKLNELKVFWGIYKWNKSNVERS